MILKKRKDEIETDVNDLAERSGRADKVFSQVTFIFIFCSHILYVFRLNL